MAKKQRDPVLERFWRETIAAWQHSGRTIRDFCRERRLTETSFHFWRRELQARAAAAGSAHRATPIASRTPSAKPPAFVPVAIVPEASVAAALEVRCPSGHVVSLSGVDAGTLRALFAALASEGRTC